MTEIKCIHCGFSAEIRIKDAGQKGGEPLIEFCPACMVPLKHTIEEVSEKKI